MKKVLTILLLGFYLTLGAVSAISMHFCHGNLIDFSVNKSAESCCGSEASNSCCEEVNLKVDFDDDRLASSTVEAKKPMEVQTMHICLDKLFFEELTYSTPHVELGEPPGKEFSNIILLTQSFLFYG